MRPLPKVSLKLLKKLLPRRRSDNNTNDTNTLNNGIPPPAPEPQEDATTVAVSATSLSPKAHNNNSKKRSTQLAPPPPEPPEECPICHDPVGLVNPEGIVEAWTSLHCGHRFGTHCIQTWLTESLERDPHANPSCPICRTTAKHPCGHLVSPPPFPSIELNWQAPRPPPLPPLTQQHHHHHHRQPVRRRLTRRPGHPLRPPPPPPTATYPWNQGQQQSQRRAQTVGECRTCAENAEFDARMRRIRESRSRQDTGESAATSAGHGGGGSSSRKTAAATAIKAIIPGLKRSSNTFRATVVHVGVDPLHHHHGHRHGHDGEERGLTPVQERVLRGSVFCTAAPSARAMPRRPTPPPGYSRRLSI